MRNPLSNGGLPNKALDRELCQRILFSALRTARRNGLAPPGILGSIFEELRSLELHAGPSIYLLHPVEVDQLFLDVTLATYLRIEKLYVDRLGRSLKTVTRVIEAMAEQASVPATTSEAIWAIGVYLDERRVEQTAVKLTHNTNLWTLTSLCLKNCIIHLEGRYEDPIIAVVIDNSLSSVLSWRVTSRESAETAYARAIYDALVLERKPGQLAPAGLSWTVPERLCIVGDMLPNLDIVCRELGIVLEVTDLQHPLATTIQAAWSDRATSIFTQQQFQLTFDRYLYRLHGFGPVRAKRQYDREFAGLLGYNRDPAWQLPALRSLLPAREAVINHEGEVEFDGMHFQDELLTLFRNTPVTLRLSDHSEATAWIYLDGEILCEARACELRRPDGTYRTRLPTGRSRFTS